MIINRGSIETFVVRVQDELGTLESLPVPTLYDIHIANNPAVIPDMGNLIAEVDGMTARCLIDSTDLEIADYDLFLKFNIPPEYPVLGPHRFRVQ